jgi:hypothetical protein
MPTTPKKKSYKRKTLKITSGASNTIKYSKAIIDNKFTLDPKKKYKTIGLVHATTAQPINLMRDWGNDIANAFGNRGFDDTLFAKARTDAVAELLSQVSNKQKIKDPHFDVELKGDQLIIINAWATLLE